MAESTRPWKGLHHRVSGRDDYGQYYDLAAALSDGPRSFDEVKAHYESYLRLLGIFTPLRPFNYNETEWDNEIRDSLKTLETMGWAEKSDNKWKLTEKGKEEAEKPLRDVRRAKRYITNIIKPETASKVSIAIHLFLALLKLPAAYLSGSIGLLNDGIDTLLDGLSSSLVYLRIKYDREKMVNVFLTLLMLGVSLLAMKESVNRLLVPSTPDVDWFTFTATIVSAIICGVLYFYQGFVGVRTGSISLITQSIDSRNHVIVAASVTAGLIATLTNYPIIDTLVGLGVALIILKSAIELLIEVIKSWGEEEFDATRYNLPLTKSYQKFRHGQLRDHLLYLVDKGEVNTFEELLATGERAYDFSNNPMLRAVGAAKNPVWAKDLESVKEELINDRYLQIGDKIHLTKKGKNHIKKKMSRNKHIF